MSITRVFAQYGEGRIKTLDDAVKQLKRVCQAKGREFNPRGIANSLDYVMSTMDPLYAQSSKVAYDKFYSRLENLYKHLRQLNEITRSDIRAIIREELRRVKRRRF